jgi:cytochrome c553
MAVVAVILMLGDNQAGEKAKYTIKEVMKEAHKEELVNKVAEGKASDEEKKRLAELYKALSLNTPKKGEAEAWKTRTVALLEAANKAVKGDEKAEKSLTKLAHCASCHKLFK